MITLRPYQTEIIGEARQLMQSGNRSILIQSPTGSGKTLLTAHMLKTAAERKMTSWFVVHRRELIKQSMRAFDSVGINFGVEANGFIEDRRPLVQIASVQSLARRWHKLKRPKLIVWDEAHHVAAKSWESIHASQPDAFHIGLTATPLRLDGTGLIKWFKAIIHGPSVHWLIENKFLSPYRLYAPSNVSMAGVHIQMGDFNKKEIGAKMDKPTITGDAIKHYQKYAMGKRAVVFAVSIEHSKHIVSQFQAAGISAAHVDGETDVNERDNAIKSFESGEIRILSNVELFGEGFDLPAIEVAILLRPTASLGLYLQQVGRSLRPSEGKSTSIILDHVANCQRHGLPDEEREWDLNGAARRNSNKDGGAPIKVCPSCFAAQSPGGSVCKFCGTLFQPEPREVKQVEGDLVEIDKDSIRRSAKREQGMASTMQDLIAIGKKRGYKNPFAWASFVFRARQARKLAPVA